MYEANVLFWTPSVVSGARAAEHITTGSIRECYMVLAKVHTDWLFILVTSTYPQLYVVDYVHFCNS